MPLKLNNIADEIVKENVAYSESRIQKQLAKAPEQRNLAALGDAYFELGTGCYQQQRPIDEIKKYLGLSGEFLTKAIFARTKSQHEPTYFERAFALAVCFGLPDDVMRGASLTNEQIFAPNDEQSKKHFGLTLEYVNLLRVFAGSGNLDIEATEKVKQKCTTPTAWKFDAIETKAKLNALESIQKGNDKQWNEALQILLNEHQNESLNGEYRKLNAAFIAIPTLVLAKLGLAKGMACTISSDYLPLQLL